MNMSELCFSPFGVSDLLKVLGKSTADSKIHTVPLTQVFETSLYRLVLFFIDATTVFILALPFAQALSTNWILLH